MSAYEELKAWCKKHLKSYCWIDTLEQGRFAEAQDAIVFPGWLTIIFNNEGKVDCFQADD